ncbi:MAG: aldo/keto reductase [Candidatus Omnitrophica bacterium]|nr:aldo/keto reductase [Candidatus Omnitrophota bacterium]
MSPFTHRICIGTAQFGLDYGVANTHGRMSEEEMKAILKYAIGHGVKTLDTAVAYGNSEEEIGRILKALGRSMDIVSKLSQGESKLSIRDVVNRSCKRLGAPKIYGYLLHSFEDYHKKDIVKELQDLKTQGTITKLGVSLYLPSEAQQLLDENAQIDIVQMPYSIFDRRFEPFLAQFKKRKIEVYVRSLFLQGLAFLEPAKLPASLAGARAQLTALKKISSKSGIPINALCLNFGMINPSIDRVIIGVDHLEHLKVNLSDLRFFAKVKTLVEDLNMTVIEDENILLPFRWKL